MRSADVGGEQNDEGDQHAREAPRMGDNGFEVTTGHVGARRVAVQDGLSLLGLRRVDKGLSRFELVIARR